MQSIVKYLALISALSLMLLLLLTCVDVTGRYIFNSPVLGAMEIEDVLMAVMMFGVLPLASTNQAHITIDILDNITPKRLLQYQIKFMQIISALIMGFLGARMWVHADKLAGYGDRSMMLKIPLAPVNYFISVLLVIAAMALLVRAVRGVKQ